MAWSAAFIAALQDGRYTPSFRLVCLADLFGRASRGELGSVPGSVPDADLVVSRVAPSLSGDGLELPTARATTGSWSLTLAGRNYSRALQYLRKGTIAELRMTLGGVEEPVALGMVESVGYSTDRGEVEVSLTGIGDVLRTRWAVSPQRLFATIRDETTLTATYTPHDSTVNVASTAEWTAGAPYFMRLTGKDGSTFVISATGKTATTFTGCSSHAHFGTTASVCRVGGRVEEMEGALLTAAYNSGDTTVSVDSTAPWADRDTLGLWAFRIYPNSGDPFIITCRAGAGGARGATDWTGCDTTPRLGGTAATANSGSAIEPVIFFFDDPVEIALSVLVSTGTGTNGSFDILPASWGLAIPRAQVDDLESRKVIAWIAPASGGQSLELLVEEGDDGVEDALAWLEGFLSLRGCFITQRHGQVCVRALFAPARRSGGPGVIAFLDERHVSRDVPLTWTSSPDGVYERLNVRTATAVRASALTTPSTARPGLGVAEVDLSGVLWTNDDAVCLETATRIGGYYTRDYVEVSLSVIGWEAWGYCAGDRILLTLADVPFPAGSAGRSNLGDRIGVLTQTAYDASTPDTALVLRVYED